MGEDKGAKLTLKGRGRERKLVYTPLEPSQRVQILSATNIDGEYRTN